MGSDDEDVELIQIMSHLFKGFQFFLLPNNRSAVSEIRRRIARENSAVVNGKFNTMKTTHILVDQKSIPQVPQLVRMLKAENVNLQDLKIPILSQTWLVQSAQKLELLPYGEYRINIKDHISREPSPSEISPKRRKLTKTEIQTESMDKEVIKDDNPNALTIAFLQQMAEERKIQGDVFKVKAYKNAIESLSKCSKYINSSYKAIQLPGIGKSIAEKIEEIVQTRNLKDLDVLKNDETMKLMKLFKGIHGCGDINAVRWIHEGMKSLKDIENRDDLNSNQRYGIKYYDDWNARIPSKECTVHNEYVTSLLQDIDPKVQLTIGGSYRRGADSCGDIDFIITRPETDLEDLKQILKKLIDKMKQTKYHKCSLSHELSKKWHGGCALPPEYNKRATGTKGWGKCRRVDFLLVPWHERGASFIYFTGNDILNKKMRLTAKKKGMNLNEHGLYRRFTDENGLEKQELLEGEDEKRIFELLGIKWREPTNRNIGDFN